MSDIDVRFDGKADLVSFKDNYYGSRDTLGDVGKLAFHGLLEDLAPLS